MTPETVIDRRLTYLDFAKLASMIAGKSGDWSAAMLRLPERMDVPVPTAVCNRYVNEIQLVLDQMRRISHAV
jgi:hypothetical protein